jgi:hypothetical protein
MIEKVHYHYHIVIYCADNESQHISTITEILSMKMSSRAIRYLERKYNHKSLDIQLPEIKIINFNLLHCDCEDQEND